MKYSATNKLLRVQYELTDDGVHVTENSFGKSVEYTKSYEQIGVRRTKFSNGSKLALIGFMIFIGASLIVFLASDVKGIQGIRTTGTYLGLAGICGIYYLKKRDHGTQLTCSFGVFNIYGSGFNQERFLELLEARQLDWIRSDFRMRDGIWTLEEVRRQIVRLLDSGVISKNSASTLLTEFAPDYTEDLNSD